MAKKKGSKKPSSAPATACPSPSAPSYFDRLAPELKIQILECCNELGGKRLALPLASTCNELRRLGEPVIFGDLKFEMDKSAPPVKDDDFKLRDVKYEELLPFRWHAKKYGSLIKSIYLEVADDKAGVEPQLMTSMMRWNFLQPALEHLSALTRLDIGGFGSLIDRDGLDGDNHLLEATPMLGKTLTSLRLVGPQSRYPMSAPRVAEIVANLPLLTSLHLENIGGPHLGMHDGPELAEAITTLHNLKELRMIMVFGNNLRGARFDAPLELLECLGLKPAELLDVISSVSSTLHTLECREWQKELHPLPKQRAPTFPRLRHLSLHINVNLSFLDYFSTSPLETLRCMQGDGYDIGAGRFEIDEALEQANLAAVRRAIRAHGSHLQRLDVQLMDDLMKRVISHDLEATRDMTPSNWRRLLAPWDEVAELGRAEGIEVSLEAWR